MEAFSVFHEYARIAHGYLSRSFNFSRLWGCTQGLTLCVHSTVDDIPSAWLFETSFNKQLSLVWNSLPPASVLLSWNFRYVPSPLAEIQLYDTILDIDTYLHSPWFYWQWLSWCDLAVDLLTQCALALGPFRKILKSKGRQIWWLSRKRRLPPRLMTWAHSLQPTWWEERTDSLVFRPSHVLRSKQHHTPQANK